MLRWPSPSNVLARHLALVLALLAAPAWATPDFQGEGSSSYPEAVSRFLAEKGLVDPAPAPPDANAPAAERKLIDRVRDKASEMVMSAMNFLGVPYRRGGTNADEGFDCSGFTRYVFENSLGLVLPRRADEQAKAEGLVSVPRTELKPGDLVFFNTLRRTFSHVGIYVGDGKFIHAPRTGASVRIEDMRGAYWSRRFTGARRVHGSDAGNTAIATSTSTSTSTATATAALPVPATTLMADPQSEHPQP
jgi:cell wall-associated NlpC family hydrolase